MTQPSEASVEEILESIKKVIARDNRMDAIETRRRRETAGVVKPAAELRDDPAEEEVLDLAEMEFVEDLDKPAESEAAVASDARQDNSLAEHFVHDEGEEQAENTDAPLTNESARESMRENLEALVMLAQPSAPPQIVRSGETSLEGLVREMLRPMLAEWLDSNLPEMVEGLVKDEIARIARKDRS